MNSKNLTNYKNLEIKIKKVWKQKQFLKKSKVLELSRK